MGKMWDLSSDHGTGQQRMCLFQHLLRFTYLVRSIMSLSACPWNYLWYYGVSVVIPKSSSYHYTSLKIDYVDNRWSGQKYEEACLHNFCVFLEECHDSVRSKVTRNLHSPRHIHSLLFQRGMHHSPCNPRKLEYLHDYPIWGGKLNGSEAFGG